MTAPSSHPSSTAAGSGSVLDGDPRVLIPLPEAAQRLGISRWQAYKLARSGRLPTTRLGARDLQVQLGRRPTMQERLATARFESRFLLLAVPPLGVLLVLRVANVTLTDSVQVVIWLEALSLSFWAGLAAWYAGLRGRSLALSFLGGLVVSIIVLSLQVFLQPGKAVNNGEAAPAEPSGAVVLVTAADSTCSPTTESDGPGATPAPVRSPVASPQVPFLGRVVDQVAHQQRLPNTDTGMLR